MSNPPDRSVGPTKRSRIERVVGTGAGSTWGPNAFASSGAGRTKTRFTGNPFATSRCRTEGQGVQTSSAATSSAREHAPAPATVAAPSKVVALAASPSTRTSGGPPREAYSAGAHATRYPCPTIRDASGRPKGSSDPQKRPSQATRTIPSTESIAAGAGTASATGVDSEGGRRAARAGARAARNRRPT